MNDEELNQINTDNCERCTKVPWRFVIVFQDTHHEMPEMKAGLCGPCFERMLKYIDRMMK